MGRLRVKRYGTRAEVMNGTARMTQGRLTKDDFVYNEYGYIVSKKSKLMKGKENPLRKKDYYRKKKLKKIKKGTFGPLKNNMPKSNNKNKKSKKNNKPKSNRK